MTHTDGKLIRLFVEEGQSVQNGQTLGYIESTARHSNVLLLSHMLTKALTIASKGNLETLSHLNLANFSQLGELQNAYQEFDQSHIQLKAYSTNGFYCQKKNILLQEIKDL
ncbi:biotin/lipoyl-binding protein [Spirosoma foliorum]|uniref:biotin/lipoyl-binding protein n=1 Tax=Spirosoma foliorum TaxID=2710596 RepID=UPI001F0A6BE1|nr:biotin/lipoyl-binding protein [Spirosoma foliorum]